METNNQVVHLPSQQQIVNVADSALSVEQIIKQRTLIEQVMKGAMKEGLHYGVIPGCGDKPTLLQPGGQLLAHLFRLRPEYEIIETDLQGGAHKRFRVTCTLFFIGSTPEIKIAQGVGESSSMESKHRYRNAAAVVTVTEDIVPPVYWTHRAADKKDNGDRCKNWLKTTYGEKNVGTKKVGETWFFCEYQGGGDGKVENPNPADVFNTVLKIAKKRAFVDATITATASSDFFTQDLEDIRDNLAAVDMTPTTGGDHAKPVTEAGGGAAGKPQDSTAGAAKGDEAVGDWRKVRVHFGKKGVVTEKNPLGKGKIYLRELGELPEDTINYLRDNFTEQDKKDPKGEKLSKDDRRLRGAVALAIAERKPGAGKKAGGEAEDDIPMTNGKNHEELSCLLDFDSVPKEVFMESARLEGWIPNNAMTFAQMPDEMAKGFVESYDSMKAHLIEFAKTKAGAK